MAPFIAVLLVSVPHVGAQLSAPAVLIDDFEAGIGKWHGNDGLEGANHGMIGVMYAVAGDAPDGGRQAGLVEFVAGRNTWASVTAEVNGEAWAEAGCNGLAMWVSGDGESRTVDLVLRAYTKGADGKAVDTSYLKRVTVASEEWHPLRVPFSSFRTTEGVAPDEDALRHVKLLQFVKTGSWQAMSFTVDEIRAEVFTVAAEPAEVGTTLVDFDLEGEASRLQLGICVGGEYDRILTDEAFSGKVIAALALLGRTTVRVKLSDFYAADGKAVRTGALGGVLTWVRSVGCDPLVCLDTPPSRTGVTPAQGWQDFGALCAQIARSRRAEPGTHTYEIGGEPLLSGQFRSIEAATDAYNALAAQVKHADPAALIGGMGFASAWDEYLNYFVGNARTLDFLTFHFYGAHSPIAEDAELFAGAIRGKASDLPHQMSLKDVRELVDGRDPEIGVWITECALNSARESSGQARDRRIQSYYGGAWLTAFATSAAPYVDRALWFKGVGHGWGLLQDDGEPTPPSQAAAMFTRFVPRGAAIGPSILVGDDAVLAPVTSELGRTVIGAHIADTSVIEVQLNGSPEVRASRLRRSDPSVARPSAEPLVPSPRQRFSLRGPGVMVVETTETR